MQQPKADVARHLIHSKKDRSSMTEETEQFALDLHDLLWRRERLNADLTKELTRSKALADAVTGLRDLNDAAERTVEYVLSSLKSQVPAQDQDDMPKFVQNGVGHHAMQRVAGGVN